MINFTKKFDFIIPLLFKKWIVRWNTTSNIQTWYLFIKILNINYIEFSL